MLRLYCFAHAGASAQVFRGWQRHFPHAVQVCAVERPGHGRRLREPLVHDFAALVEGLADDIVADLRDPLAPATRYALFGHSAGAAFAFSTGVRVAERLGQPPVRCVLSAGAAPHRPRKRRSALSEEALIAEMRALSGTPARLLDDPALRDVLLPILRADFAAYEGCGIDGSRRLDCPLSLHAAEADLLPREDVWAWQRHGLRGVDRRVVPGDHFSVLQSPQAWIGDLHADLDV